MAESLEQEFAAFVQEAVPVLTESERGEIAHFLEVNEFGLAFETALDIFREEHKNIPAELLERLERIAVAMGIDTRMVQRRLARE